MKRMAEQTRASSATGSEELLRASQDGDLNNVKNLVEVRHVDPHPCRDEQLRTPLHLASQHGHLDIVKYLVEERNCDVVCRDKNEDTPLHLAALGGRPDIVQYLISERGCDSMCRGQYGRTPLHSACQGDRLDVVKYLIEDVKVDSSCRDVNEATPLHIAALCGELSVVKLLVEDYQCDTDVRNKNGETPADEAKRMGHTHIISYLSINALRLTIEAQLEPYTRKATPTGKVFGSGTYGSVIQLTTARETMAGKVFRMSSTAQMLPVAFRVCDELMTMVRLHHPNIVQCKGVSFLTDQPLPVLLMEQLMSSLHAYLLHPDNSNLSVERKVSILHDTASGLEYLHNRTPAIIHRDLTAKNVLLDSQLRAKISDFGNSRIVDLDPEASPETLTPLPGTLEYMPPEAQGSSVAYDPGLDVFSFGHLSLFTVTQTPVRPLLPPNYSDSNGKLLGRSEVKRRARFVEAAEQVLSENHSLVAVMKQCLHNNPAQRPRTVELVTRLQEMVTPGSASSTPADTHSPSYGRGPVEADSETDNSPTEKSSSATGGHTDPSSSTTKRVRQEKASPDPPAEKVRPPHTLDCDDLFDVKNELIPVATRWKPIGLALRLDPDQLFKIESDHGTFEDRLTEVLHLWLKKAYNSERFGEPSWTLLARAVGHPAGGNDRALAEKIAKKYGEVSGLRHRPRTQTSMPVLPGDSSSGLATPQGLPFLIFALTILIINSLFVYVWRQNV